MYKLIALDMDGTLLSHQGTISDVTHNAIQSAKAQGVHVVLASGRPLEGMSKYLEQLNLNSSEDYVLCYNGSLVQKVACQSVIRSQMLTGKDAADIQAIANQLDINIHAFSRSQGLITPQISHYTEVEANLNGLSITEIDFSTLAPEEEILKVMMIDEPEKLSNAIHQLPPELYEQYTIVQSTPFFLEFMNKSSNKGTGIAALADHLGLHSDQVICVGDAGNDLHMIEYAGLGVAMANATDDVKAAANHITASNDDDGVAKVFDKFILTA